MGAAFLIGVLYAFFKKGDRTLDGLYQTGLFFMHNALKWLFYLSLLTIPVGIILFIFLVVKYKLQ